MVNNCLENQNGLVAFNEKSVEEDWDVMIKVGVKVLFFFWSSDRFAFGRVLKGFGCL